jgi:hypothetical protein
MSIMPHSSPWAPAAGCSVSACMPVRWSSQSRSSAITRNRPACNASGSSGCAPAKPHSRATRSPTRGLYFIVHDPSGYMWVSMLALSCDRRV